MEDSSQSREHGMSLLLHRQKITTDTAKSGDPSRTPKGARNLLLNFCPTKVSLGLVVRKRNPQIVEQSQHLIGMPKQGIQQILGLALLGSTFPFARGRHQWRRLSGIASGQNLEIASDPVVALDGGNRAQVEETPLVAGVMQIEQEVLHLAGPLLMLLLGDGRTSSHQVGSTEAVRTLIGLIARQSVVHASPGKARPDADFVHGLPATRGMPSQMGQKARAVHMQPMQHAIHADARLVSMLELAGHEQLGNALDRRSQPLCCQFAPLQQGGFRDVAATDRSQRLAGASRWEQLPLVQIHRQCLQVGTILDRRADRNGKAAEAAGVTGWATDGFDLMLLYHQANFRHVQDLTVFCDDAGDSAEVLTALTANRGTVTHHFIWLLHHQERVPRVSRLTSRTLAARTTRTAWQTCQPIRRGRLIARSTVLCQSVFELLDAGTGLQQLLFQREQLGYQRFEHSIFFSQGLQFFFFRHRCTLVGFLCFGKSVGDLSSYYILVIDDDEFANSLIQFVLSKEGYEVETTSNPRGAMQMISKREPDLLIVDVMMPYLNGFDFAAKLREGGFGIPFIFMTAQDAIEAKLQGFGIGADDYICKPFNHLEIVLRVRAVLRRLHR